MKKVLIITVALLAMVAFVSGVAMAKGKSQNPMLGSASEAKLQTSAKLQGVGVVSAYDAAAKTLKVKVKDQEYDLAVAEDATIKGAVKPGAKVRVDYKKEGDKRIATSISVMSAKRAARAEKAQAEKAQTTKESAAGGKKSTEVAKPVEQTAPVEEGRESGPGQK